jgi:succinate dehydrogenase flavin-adding protein (antitoxin of CptAB toxin-antitoxin module)
MIEKDTLIKEFVKNFVQKDKAERSCVELSQSKKRSRFYDRLNHNWENVLNMKHLTQLSKAQDNHATIQEMLDFKDNEMCYVISNYSEYDDKFFPFKDIFVKIYARGFATILVNTSGDTLFLDTEYEQGTPPRFIGKITK